MAVDQHTGTLPPTTDPVGEFYAAPLLADTPAVFSAARDSLDNLSAFGSMADDCEHNLDDDSEAVDPYWAGMGEHTRKNEEICAIFARHM